MTKIYYTKSEHIIATILSIVSIILSIALIVLSAYVGAGNKKSKPNSNYYSDDNNYSNDSNYSSIYNSSDSLKPGEIIKFGKYEQDDNKRNGSEDIKWIVLDVQGDKALIISKYILDYCRANIGKEIWENSLMREWLNQSFINTAFNDEEKAIISTTSLTTEALPGFTESSTTDRVFLLDRNETEKYFPDKRARICEATQYSMSRGVGANEETNISTWWIRSSDYINYRVYTNGQIEKDTVGNNVSGARPAMWININN